MVKLLDEIISNVEFDFLTIIVQTTLFWLARIGDFMSKLTSANYFFCALILFVVWEWGRPYIRTSRNRVIGSYYHNATIFVFNNLTLSVFSLTTLYIVAQQWIDQSRASYEPNSIIEWMVLLLVIDFSAYVWHMANHKIPYLWAFHRIHHSDMDLNVSTAVRFHVLELALTVLYKCVVMVMLGITEKAMILAQSITACFTLFHHSNVSFKGEQLLSKLCIVPSLHRLHHSTKRTEHDNNYGSIFSLWDRLFGTFMEALPKRIGLDNINVQNLWESIRYGFSPLTPDPVVHSTLERSGANSDYMLSPLTNSAPPNAGVIQKGVEHKSPNHPTVTLFTSYLEFNMNLLHLGVDFSNHVMDLFNYTPSCDHKIKDN